MTKLTPSNTYAYSAHLKIICAQFHKLLAQGKVHAHLDESRQVFSGTPSSDLNEAQVRQSFILPIIAALGWNTGDPFEVYPEERVNGGFADIRLRTKDGESVIWEIKRTKVSLDLGTEDGKEAAYQGVGYARTFSNSPYCLVSNFEQTLVFHSYNLPDRNRIHENLVAKFTWVDLRDGNLEELINHLTKESTESGRLRKYLDEKVKKKALIRTKKPLAKRILDDLEAWRILLFNEFLSAGCIADLKDLDLAIQILINRILFIRCCEDRGLETRAVIRNLLSQTDAWKELVGNIFPNFRASYNSDIFLSHSIIDDPNWQVSDECIKQFLEGTFSGTTGNEHEVYDFSIIPLEILGSAYESYIAKQFVIVEGKIELELKPEVKKSGGVCYTPSSVVDYIVKSTLNSIKNSKGAFLPKVLDPACGSGTFLISVLRELIDRNRPVLNKKSEKRPVLSLKEKKTILESCVFGVDLDSKAVEITKLSLLLQLLEGENEGLLLKTAILPSLQKNIRCGNSLITPKEVVDNGEAASLSELTPLDWDDFLRKIKSSEGFDAIVGNPPYVRIQVLQEFYPKQALLYSNIYEAANHGNVDLYLPFIERAISLCRKGGHVAFILPSRFWTNEYGKNIREQISQGSHLRSLVNFRAEQVFESVTTYTCILGLSKSKSKLFDYVEIERDEPIEKFLIDISDGATPRWIEFDSKILEKDPWLLAPTEIRSEILNIEKRPKKLLDFIDARNGVFQGLITGCDPVFLMTKSNEGNKYFSEAQGCEVDLENTYILPVLKGSAGIKRLKNPEVNLNVLFPYSGSPAALANLSSLRDEAPLTFAYFNLCEKQLRARSALKTKADRDFELEENPEKFRDPENPEKLKWFYSEDDFYKYSRNQALDCVRKPKMIVPSLFKEPTFFWDHSGGYAITGSGSGGGGAYAMYISSEYLSFAFALVGLLSSESMMTWFERRGDLFSGYYIGVDEKTLLNVPLPDLSSKKYQKDLEALSGLVQAVLDMNSSNETKRAEIIASINSISYKLLTS